MEDEVVFAKPLRIRLDQRRCCSLQLLSRDAGRVAFKVHIPHPAAAQTDQRVPVPREGQFENHAQHAIVVVLDLSFQTFTTFQNQRFNRLDDRGPLVANVAWSRMLEAGLLEGPRTENLAELIEPDLLAHVELNQHQDGAVKRRFDCRLGLHLRRGVCDCKGIFAVPGHTCCSPATNAANSETEETWLLSTYIVPESGRSGEMDGG